MKNDRLLLFDLMKGVAILLVIIGHVVFFCIDSGKDTFVMKSLDKIHMPLFFFISGWFSMKIDENNNFTRPNLVKRACQLIAPMVIVSSLWVLFPKFTGMDISAYSFKDLWSNDMKGGYWFTFVLFQIILVYFAIIPVLNRFKSCISFILISLVAAGVINIGFCLMKENIRDWLSLYLTASFFPLFMLGVFARRYYDLFKKIVLNSWMQSFAIIIFVASIVIIYNYHFSPKLMVVINTFVRAIFAVIAFNIFLRWDNIVKNIDCTAVSSRITRFYAFVGRNSLGIYLLHFFLLFPLGEYINTFISSVNYSAVPLITIAYIVASLIIFGVLAIIECLKPSRFLSYMLTGQQSQKIS